VQQRYSLGAIVLHWLLALALAFQLSLGLRLEDLGLRGFAAFQLHKSVGVVVLLLTLLRLLWRLRYRPPPAAERGFTGGLAKAVHFGLYVFMIGAPLTGWLLVSTDKVKVPTLLFGMAPWPHLPLPESLNGFAHGSHALLGWLGIALILLHVAGALRHQWLIRDNLMARMAPARGLWLLLALLVPIGWLLGIAASDRGEPVAAQEEASLSEADVAEPAAPDAAANPAPTVNEAAAVPPPSAAPPSPPAWTIKPGGTLAFSVRNGASDIAGRFARWQGEIVFDPDQPESADIAITIDLASASVGDATQDAMLGGGDFLDAATHPRATFRTQSVRRTGANRYVAQGTLSLRGKSQPQSLTFTLSGSGPSRHVEGSATIDRTAFGIGMGETGTSLAPQVSVHFSLDAEVRAAE